MTIKTPWRAVSAMFLLNGGLYGIWAARIPAVAEKHDLGPAELGLLLLLLAGGAIVAFPLAGRAADRFGAAAVCRWAAIVYTIWLFAIGLAPTVPLLALALFLCGTTFGGLDVAMNSWAGEVERHMGRPVMASFHGMFSLGAGVGAGTGYLAVQAGMGIETHFILAGGLLSAVMIWMSEIGWTSPKRGKEPGAPVFAIPRGALFFVGLMAFCSAMGEGALADWSAIYLVMATGVDEARAALGFTVFSVAMVIVRLVADQVILRLGAVQSARIAGMVAALGAVIAVGFAGSYAMVLLGFAVMGIGYAFVFPLAFSRAANDPNMSPGAAIASVATLGYGGILLGPPVIGFVAEISSLPVAFLILAVMALAITGFARALRAEPVGDPRKV